MNFSAIPSSTLLGRTGRAVLRLVPENLVVPILQGRLRGKRWIVGAGVHGYWLGSYEWEKRRAFEAAVSPGAVVYDVGANVGYYTLLAAELAGASGSVVAFEPLARNLRYLETHLSLNHVGNVLVSRAAVWDQTGSVRFDTGPNNSQGSAGTRGDVEVSAVTLDDFRVLENLPFPTVIKMDIEGGEFRALQGATDILTRAAPTIFLATHGAEVHKRCCDFLESLGYELPAIVDRVPLDVSDELVARKAQNRAAPAVALPAVHVRIRPSTGWVSLNLRAVWEYRELLYFLTWRDIKVRYKQTALGAAWAVIQPFMTMVAFSLFFGQLGKIPSDGLPYPIFSYTALLPWSFFAYALSQSSNSLVGSSNLISKVYFPRLVIPIASVLGGVLDFVIAFAVLLGMMVFYRVWPTEAIALLPLFLLLALVTALGVGLWLSALNVEYRDVRYVMPFLTQFWLFATPVAYPSSLLAEPWRTLYGLNPMVGVVEGFRWALLATTPPGPMLGLSVLVALVLLVTGAFYFRRMERRFADVV